MTDTEKTGDAHASQVSAEHKDDLYIKEVREHEKRYQNLLKFTGSTTRAAAIMLVAAIIALIVANTALYEPFVAFWETEVGFVFGETHASLTLAEVINDIFMALFFLLVGLEIKYEMTVGELTNIRQAILPIMAACGGVLMPIVIYSLCNIGSASTAHGWGVPTATDIAFALGIMALLGNRVPNGVRVFLSTLAVADDIIAILIIAVFYGQTPSALWLGLALAVFLVLMVMNRCHVFALAPYLIGGVVLWYCVFMSGVHSTIAGVLLAFTIPGGSRVDLRSFISWSGAEVRRAGETFDAQMPVIAQDDYLKTVAQLSRVAKQVVPPATRLEHALYPWVYFFILPLFALTNADVSFISGDMGALFSNPALYGVFFGLLIGKPLGIFGMSFIIVKLHIAELPKNVNWVHMIGAGILGGVGFTMAIFVANLSFSDPANITAAKVGILAASALAGIIGFLFLTMQARIAKKQGVSYLTTKGDEAFAPTIYREATEETERVLQEIDDPQTRDELLRAMKRGSGVAEVMVDLDDEEAEKK